MGRYTEDDLIAGLEEGWITPLHALYARAVLARSRRQLLEE